MASDYRSAAIQDATKVQQEQARRQQTVAAMLQSHEDGCIRMARATAAGLFDVLLTDIGGPDVDPDALELSNRHATGSAWWDWEYRDRGVVFRLVPNDADPTVRALAACTDARCEVHNGLYEPLTDRASLGAALLLIERPCTAVGVPA